MAFFLSCACENRAHNTQETTAAAARDWDAIGRSAREPCGYDGRQGRVRCEEPWRGDSDSQCVLILDAFSLLVKEKDISVRWRGRWPATTCHIRSSARFVTAQARKSRYGVTFAPRIVVIVPAGA